MNEIKINSLLKHKPFELDEVKKKKLFSEALYESFNHHLSNNDLFKKFYRKVRIIFNIFDIIF